MLVLVFTIITSMRVSDRFFSFDSSKLIDLVLPVAGTIVALALPAAQLAQSVLDRFLATAEELIKAGDPIGAIHSHLVKEADSHRRLLGATRFMVQYGLASFLIALTGALGIAKGKRLGPAFDLADVTAALAAGLLLAAVLWFLPVMKLAFDFSSGERLLELLSKHKPQAADAVASSEHGKRPALVELPEPEPEQGRAQGEKTIRNAP
jgi:hypothetical protein